VVVAILFLTYNLYVLIRNIENTHKAISPAKYKFVTPVLLFFMHIHTQVADLRQGIPVVCFSIN
jgi:hypothetical protein